MPTNGRLLLDTNAVSAALDGGNTVVQVIAQAQAIYIPSIVLGELYFGAFNSPSPHRSQYLLLYDAMASQSAVLSCDAGTARVYGQVRSALKAKDRPIPSNDMWIAALVMQYNLTLLTHDAHFNSVDGLTVERW